MAKNLSSSGAFEVAGTKKPRLASRNRSSAPETRETFQFNCLLDRDLRLPLQIARATEGKRYGDIIEPLLRDYLVQGGYIK